jgi:hypothetical protein
MSWALLLLAAPDLIVEVAPEDPLPVSRFRADFTTWAGLDAGFAQDEDVFEWWSTFGLTWEHRQQRLDGNGWFAKGGARVRWGMTAEDAPRRETFLLYNTSNDDYVAEAELREAYAGWHFGDFELAAGNRIYTWGKNEVGAAADVLNPIDIRFDPVALVTGPRGAKAPVLAADASYGVGDTVVALVLVPFYHGHRFVAAGRDFALLSSFPAVPDIDWLDSAEPSAGLGSTPDETPGNASAALRLTSSIGGWDFGATAYYGWDRAPYLELDPDLVRSLGGVPDGLAVLRMQQKLANGQPLAATKYQRMALLALEGETTLGPLVVRADMGFTPWRVYYADNLASYRLPTASVALGAEYTYGERLMVSATGLGTAVFAAPRNATLLGIDAIDKDRDGTIALQLGAAAALRWTIWGCRLDLAALGTVLPGELAVVTSLTYVDWEPHEIALGAVAITGVDGSAGGQFRGNDFSYLRYHVAW